ncbi:hypothetical protein P7K49_035187 [Saguinus oedipus]|uniref:Uncharacterized protein n=1 Tax=Saguinus oedipus TaxID=9490 RepID=A0ABQ9TXQ2_SAGOE|nr:hypothetical protein P7K49_035187 [Saguinus oedipus]
MTAWQSQWDFRRSLSRSSPCTDNCSSLTALTAPNPAYPTWFHGGDCAEVPGSGNGGDFLTQGVKAVRERHLFVALQPGPAVGIPRRSQKGSWSQTPVGCSGESGRHRDGRGQCLEMEGAGRMEPRVVHWRL